MATIDDKILRLYADANGHDPEVNGPRVAWIVEEITRKAKIWKASKEGEIARQARITEVMNDPNIFV